MAEDPLHILGIEPRFPGRLGPAFDWLVRRRGFRATLLCHTLDPQPMWPETVDAGMAVIQFDVGGVAREPAAPWTRSLERGLCYAYGAWEVLDVRRVRPVDVVLGRSAGLGSTLFATVTYPRTPVVNLFDGYVRPRAGDLWPEDGARLPFDYACWRRTASAMDLLDLENGVVPWTPTAWQRDTYPAEHRDRFRVLHDGVDASRFAAARRASRRPIRVGGRTIDAGTRLVTFVARRLDRLRGFDRFLRLANGLLRERADVVCVAVGGGAVERMLDIPHHGRDYGAFALAADPPADPDRLVTPGFLDPGSVAALLGASDLHVVAAREAAVSRSTLEAMAAGAPILAVDTPALREAIAPGASGLLAPADDPDALLRAALAALADPAALRPMAVAAAGVVCERFDREATGPALAGWLNAIAGRGA
jgi:glycosyltransferase involved in cell wall biosynthesis